MTPLSNNLLSRRTVLRGLGACLSLPGPSHYFYQETNVNTQINKSRVILKPMLFISMILLMAANVNADTSGLNAEATDELRDAGVDKYLGTSVSTTSEHGVWTKHAFDPLSGSRPQGGGMNNITSDTMKMGHHAFTRPQGSPCLMNSIPFIDRK